MKCWAIKKILPLYVGESDFPLFSNRISAHIKKCSACSQLHNQYLHNRNVLKKVQEPMIPQQYMIGFWDELESRIAHEQQQKNPFFLPLLKQCGVAVAATLLIVGSAFFITDYTNLFKDTPAKPNFARYSKTPKTPLKLLKKFPKASEKSNVILFKNENDTEYKLDEVKLLKSNDASF